MVEIINWKQKFGIKTNKNIPWLKYYGDVPAKLNYFNGSMVDNIIEISKKYPSNYAYEYYGKTCTYKDLVKKIESVAKSLKCLGVRENDKVTICMPNTPEGVVMFYAVNMIGAVANMIHPLSSVKEIEDYLNKAKSRVMLTIDIAYNKVKEIRTNTDLKKVIVVSPTESMNPLLEFGYWITKGRKNKIELDANIDLTWKEFLKLGEGYKKKYHVNRKSNDIAAILFSGGTTGQPNGIMLSNLCFNSIALQCEHMVKEAKAGESILSAMPIFHGFGLGICIHAPLTIGMKCILLPQVNLKKLNNLIKSKKPNFIPAIPPMLERIINNRTKKNAFKSVTSIVCGGDFLNYDLKNRTEKFLKKYGSNAAVRIGYGLTEATAATCVSPINNYKPGCIGIPFPDNYYKIVKLNTNEEADVGTDGEICVRGPSVMKGYLDNEKETYKSLRIHSDGKIWLHTGDIGSMDKDGLFYFKTRLKRMIISNGYNIYPTYIEEIVNKHPKVATSVVVGISHKTKQQVAKVFIVLKEKVRPTSEVQKEIKDYCEKHIAKYSMPKYFEYKESLPKTKLGKVAFTELK